MTSDPFASSGSDPRPVLAFDIGGTKLAVAVVTADGTAHGLLIEPTRCEQGWTEVTRRLFDMGRRALTAAGVDEIRAVGIACGGPLDAATGMILCPPNLPDWRNVPIGPLAAQSFGVPFALQNDATAGAIAEHRFGAGRGTASMLYLTVSTGIGGGAVLNGSIHEGATGNGGEFGHVTVRRGGRRCGCGRRGCVEAYASGTAVAQRAREALATGAASSMSTLSSVTAADVAQAAAVGDPLARDIWAETVDLLGAAVTDLVNVFEPDLVVLGGGVTRAGDMLVEPVREVVAREAMLPVGRTPRVVRAALADLACVVGAGAIGHDLVAASEQDRTAGQPAGKETEEAHA